MNGNDFQTWRQPGDDALVLAVAKGIRSADPDALQTVELNFLTSTSLDDPRWRGIIGLDAAYTYAPTYAEVLKAYGRRDHLPVFMIEANYEGEHCVHRPIDAATPGVLDDAERSDRAVLWQQVHLAVLWTDGRATWTRSGRGR